VILNYDTIRSSSYQFHHLASLNYHTYNILYRHIVFYL